MKDRLLVSAFFTFAVGFSLLFLKQGEAGVMDPKGMIKLPQPSTRGRISLEEAIQARRSQRLFEARDLSQDQVAQLLWAAQGITQREGRYSFRVAPSAGALYPAEIYLLNKDGVFRYIPESHELERLAQKDLRRDLSSAAWGPDSIIQAPHVFVIAAKTSRTTVKYGERGIRYVYMEAGHIAQNLHLQAVALGLGSLAIGAFDDSQAGKVLSLPAAQELLYIIPLGYTE